MKQVATVDVTQENGKCQETLFTCNVSYISFIICVVNVMMLTIYFLLQHLQWNKTFQTTTWIQMMKDGLTLKQAN